MVDNYVFQIANNKVVDHTALMHRLVCGFVIRMQQSQVFSRRGQNNLKNGSFRIERTYKNSNLKQQTWVLLSLLMKINEKGATTLLPPSVG